MPSNGAKEVFLATLKKKYVCVEEVPLPYKEKYILTGYRQPCSSLADCVVSIFRLNNETLNIWTHFLPFVFLLRHFYKTFPSELYPLEPSYYPLLSLELSICCYLLGSTLAHTFNCMTPRIRHICFYVDYVAISMYGVGGACTNFYYLRPLGTGFFLFDSPNLFIGGASLCNLISTYFTCASRHKWEPAKYVIRTLSFALPFLYGNSLTFVRLFLCVFAGRDECSVSLVFLFLCWTAYLVCAVLNATRFPERLYPATFDNIGHNHQWVHVLTSLGTVCHFWAVQTALEARKDLMPALLDGLTFSSSLGWMLGTLFVASAMAVWFGYQLTTDGHLASHKQKKP